MDTDILYPFVSGESELTRGGGLRVVGRQQTQFAGFIELLLHR